MSHAAVIEDRAAPIMSTSMSFNTGQQECDDYTRQCRMGETVTDEAFLAQYCEGARNTTGKAQESCAEQYHTVLYRIGVWSYNPPLAVGALDGLISKGIYYGTIGNSLLIDHRYPVEILRYRI